MAVGQLGKNEDMNGNRKLRYRTLALVSHPRHVARLMENLGEGDGDTLIVSCNWLLAEELATQGNAAIYIDDESRRTGAIPAPSRELYLRGADWLHADGGDPTLFRGVSLGRRFLRDVAFAQFEIGFYEHVLPPMVRRFKPKAIEYWDCRTDWGPLDSQARFDTVSVIARDLGVDILDKRQDPPADGLGLPHHNYLPVKATSGLSLPARAKNATFNLVMDAMGRVRRLALGRRSMVLLLTTALNGKPLLETFNGKDLGVYYPAEWFPGKSRIGFVLRCFAKGVILVNTGQGFLSPEDHKALNGIRDKIKTVISKLDGPFAQIMRDHITRSVLENRRLEAAARHVVNCEKLIDRLNPALVFTDGLQNAFTNTALAVAKKKGCLTAATWHAPYIVDHCMEIFGSDPHTPALADYCLTWGRGHEDWLDANGATCRQIRTGNIIASRVRKAPTAPRKTRKALVLQYLPVMGDSLSWYTPSAEFNFFIETVKMLANIGFDEIRFKLHPANIKFDYYKRIAKTFGLRCGIIDDSAFLDHIDWADIVVSIPSSGASLEVLASGKPFYPVLLEPNMIEKRYLYGLRTLDSVGALRQAILTDEESYSEEFLEAFTSEQEINDPAKCAWQGLKSITAERIAGEIQGAAVFLDRDGVINRSDIRDGKPFAPTTLEGFDILPGVQGALSALNDAGFKIIVTTNQPDVKKGIVDKAVVEAMNDRLRQSLAIDDIKVCYHVNEDLCDCRKPKPGMLVEAAVEWGIDLEKSFMVGDRWGDVEAGKAAGCRTIFIDHQYTEKRPDAPDFTAHSLVEAATLILSGMESGKARS